MQAISASFSQPQANSTWSHPHHPPPPLTNSSTSYNLPPGFLQSNTSLNGRQPVSNQLPFPSSEQAPLSNNTPNHQQPPQPQSITAVNPNPNPQMPTHTRTPSFFSAFRKHSNNSTKNPNPNTQVDSQASLSQASPNGSITAPQQQQLQPSSSQGVAGGSTQGPLRLGPIQAQLQPQPQNMLPLTQSQSTNTMQQPPLPPLPPPHQEGYPPRPQLQQSPPPPPLSQQQLQQMGATANNPGIARSPSQQQKLQPPAGIPAASAPLHPEIRSVVQLTVAHAHKIYFSGPLVRRLERQPDGQAPHKDEGWVDVWAQLGGTTLSIWDMKEIQEASRQGREVPPSYVNVTDAFVQVLGSVTVPATANSGPKRYTNVLTLNTAGSNLLLFSCPSTAALISWATALRLSAWEKSRLEEIYTAHLIRITLNVRDSPTTLNRGKMEGWAQIRIAGQTDWKRVWMVVTAGSDIDNAKNSLSRPTSHTGASSTPNSGPQTQVAPAGTTDAVPRPPLPLQSGQKKHRISNLFSRTDPNPANASIPLKTTIAVYTSMKPKDKKKALMTMTGVTQVFAVYPERPELISRSTLIKVEGVLGDEEMAGTMKSREGWVLIMPDLEGMQLGGGGGVHLQGQSKEMLKWVVALHDAFGLYGRPSAWTWDPRDPASLMFGYPVGPQKDALFLEREVAETMDPRDDRTSAIRSGLRDMLGEHMRSTRPSVQAVRPQQPPFNDGPPLLPPINGLGAASPSRTQPTASTSGGSGGPQLPPLSFGGTPPHERPLTPITEKDSVMTHSKSMSVDVIPNSQGGPSSASPFTQQPASPISDKLIPSTPPPTHQNSLLDRMISSSPTTIHSPTLNSAPPPLSGTTLSSPTKPSLESSHSPAGSFDHKNVGGGGGFTGYSQANAPLGSPIIGAQTGRPSLDSITNRSVVNSLSSAGNASSPLSHNRAGSLGQVVQPQPQSSSSQSQVLLSQVVQPQPQTQVDEERTQETLSTYSGTDDTSNLSYAKDAELFNNHNTVRALSPVKKEDRSIVALSPPPPVALSPQQKQQQRQEETSPAISLEDNDFSNVAGALFFMQNQADLASAKSNNAQSKPLPPRQEVDDDDYDSSSDNEYQQQQQHQQHQPQSQEQHFGSDTTSLTSNNSRGPVRKSTPMAFMERPSGSTTNNSYPAPITVTAGIESDLGSRSAALVDRVHPNNRTLGRKPSGARAPQATMKSTYTGGGFGSTSPPYERHEEESEDEHDMGDQRGLVQQKPLQQLQQQGEEQRQPTQPPQQQDHQRSASFEAPNAEVLAALAYMNVNEHERDTQGPPPQQAKAEPLNVIAQPTTNGAPTQVTSASTLPESSGSGSAFKSSFAPSKQAEERKKKVQAQQAAHHAAVTKPGRSNGKRKSGMSAAWGESTDEEEEEEEDEDEDDVDSDGDRPRPPRMQQQMTSSTGSLKPMAPHPSSNFVQSHSGLPIPSDQYMVDGGQHMQQTYSNMRPRTLPQIPPSRPMADDYHGQPLPPRRQPSDQYTDGGRRPYYDDGPHIRTQAEVPAPGAARQNVWSQVLDAGRNPSSGFHPPNEPSHGTRDTFVQLEPSETMTKAFTPQGLLSAGIQDKQDRSAKRQEELARETGASLINVPNKPPPPQTGLLGAITAHERERKRDGGVGAALTEREREKRVVEERQRRFDEHQRQQFDQMQQGGGGSMYGGQYGYNPMMANPMMMGMGMNPMMGMAPMMTGGGMGGPMMGPGGAGGMTPMMTGGGMNAMNPMMGYPMMGGFNPQHLYAAQQAAQAYQQAMMAFSIAGSQVGGEGGTGGGEGMGGQPQQQLNPNMTGGGMPMGGFDPRMSMNMLNMGMMGSQPMGNPQMGGMGLNPQMMMNPAPMGMQMTGMSQFDSRFSPAMNPGNTNSSSGNLSEGGPLPPAGMINNLAPGMSNGGSPVGRGSPLARGGEIQQQQSSRTTSPKH